MMNDLLKNIHIATGGWILLILLLTSTALLAWMKGRIQTESLQHIRRILQVSVGFFLPVNLFQLALGLILIRKGILDMSSYELLESIANIMHWIAVAFSATALLTAFLTMIAALCKKGDIPELKKLLRDCIIIAVLFWFLAWLLI